MCGRHKRATFIGDDAEGNRPGSGTRVRGQQEASGRVSVCHYCGHAAIARSNFVSSGYGPGVLRARRRAVRQCDRCGNIRLFPDFRRPSQRLPASLLRMQKSPTVSHGRRCPHRGAEASGRGLHRMSSGIDRYRRDRFCHGASRGLEWPAAAGPRHPPEYFPLPHLNPDRARASVWRLRARARCASGDRWTELSFGYRAEAADEI